MARSLGWKIGGTLLTLTLATGCSSLFRRQPNPSEDASANAAAAPTPTPDPEKVEMRNQIISLNQKVDVLETKLAVMNDKLSQQKAQVNAAEITQRVKSAGVAARESDGEGENAAPAPLARDPEQGYINDDAMDTYRKSYALYLSKKYPEAILAFSNFLEKYADHALAGNAQFFIGESYFGQKEYKLAIQEYQRVLTSYDRSPHISEALRRLSESEDFVKNNSAAAHHRQILLSTFPQSPAAAQIAEMSPETEKHPALPKAPAPLKAAPSLDEPPLPTAPLPSETQGTKAHET